MLKIKQDIQFVKFLLLIVFGLFFFSFFVNCALCIILILISNESFVYFIVYWWIYAFEGNVIFNILFNLKNTTFILQQTILSRTTLMFLYRPTNNDYLKQLFDNNRGPSSDTKKIYQNYESRNSVLIVQMTVRRKNKKRKENTVNSVRWVVCWSEIWQFARNSLPCRKRKQSFLLSTFGWTTMFLRHRGLFCLIRHDFFIYR